MGRINKKPSKGSKQMKNIKAIIIFSKNKEYTTLNTFNKKLYSNDTGRRGKMKQMVGDVKQNKTPQSSIPINIKMHDNV